MKQTLIVEDDAAIVELVRIHLQDVPCEVVATASGREGLALAEQGAFALVILDVMLPDLNGLDVCRAIRARDPLTPVLMLTAKAEEIDKVLGLELGADDYLTKPFGVREFLARVKALLRRAERRAEQAAAGHAPAPAAESLRLSHGDLHVDAEKRSVRVGARRVELTPKEFDLLWLLARHPGRTYSRKQLLREVWGYEFEGYEHTVTAHINRLRTKIEPDFAQPTHVLTTWGVGYRFAEQPTAATAA